MDTPTTGSRPDVDLALDVVRLYGNNTGRDWYAGVRASTEDDEIVVFRKANADFDGAVAKLVPDGVRVTFLDAPHSRAELLEARERVIDLTDVISLVDVRIPADGTQLRVAVGGSVQDAEQLLRQQVPGMASVSADLAL